MKEEHTYEEYIFPVKEGKGTLVTELPKVSLSPQEDIEYFKRKLDSPHISPRTREKVEAQISILEDALSLYNLYKVR